MPHWIFVIVKNIKIKMMHSKKGVNEVGKKGSWKVLSGSKKSRVSLSLCRHLAANSFIPFFSNNKNETKSRSETKRSSGKSTTESRFISVYLLSSFVFGLYVYGTHLLFWGVTQHGDGSFCCCYWLTHSFCLNVVIEKPMRNRKNSHSSECHNAAGSSRWLLLCVSIDFLCLPFRHTRTHTLLTSFGGCRCASSFFHHSHFSIHLMIGFFHHFLPPYCCLMFDTYFNVYTAPKERVASCTATNRQHTLFFSFVSVVCIAYLFFLFICISYRYYSNFSLSLRATVQRVHPHSRKKAKCTKITNEMDGVRVRNKCFSHYVWWSVHKYYSYLLMVSDAINVNNVCVRACVCILFFVILVSRSFQSIEFIQTHYLFSVFFLHFDYYRNWIFFIRIESILKCDDQMDGNLLIIYQTKRRAMTLSISTLHGWRFAHFSCVVAAKWMKFFSIVWRFLLLRINNNYFTW